MIHFTLKRKGWGYEDVYEALKTGEKDIEWRPASDFWISRLFMKKYQESIKKLLKFLHHPLPAPIDKKFWKTDKARFVVGYTKYPRLLADIDKIWYHSDSGDFSIHIKNVKEERMSKCIYCGEWIPLGDYMCDACYNAERYG